MALLSIPAYFLASRFVVTAVVIQGRSMMPTLKDGEHYYLNRWQYLLMSPKRGDIVVIKDPGHTDFAVKRIVAQPFDWINLKNGCSMSTVAAAMSRILPRIRGRRPLT